MSFRRQQPSFKSRLEMKWDLLVWSVVSLGVWFVTLPSLDKSTKHHNGIIVHPSRGTPGSAFQTQDGQWYVRTRRGVRKVSPAAGKQLKKRQRVIRSAAIAARAAVATVVASVVLGVIVGLAAISRSL